MSSLPVLAGPADKAAIAAFLAEYKPSRSDLSLGPWIWVQIHDGKDTGGAKPAEDLDEEDSAYAAFSKEGATLVEDMTERVDEIKKTAPVRANKKTGTRSQKDLREETFAEFNAAVKKLAQKHKILTGKWLFYPAPENVDFVWATLVRAIAEPDGVLAKTGAVHTAKVATTPKGDGERSSFVICVYVDDSYDEKAVGGVFKVLVKDLSMTSQAYKPDALTILGIDSKHSSGIKVSLYGKNTFMTKDEIDAAFEAHASKGKKVKEKTLEEEQAAGAADGFDPVSDSDEDDKPRKKAKLSK